MRVLFTAIGLIALFWFWAAKALNPPPLLTPTPFEIPLMVLGIIVGLLAAFPGVKAVRTMSATPATRGAWTLYLLLPGFFLLLFVGAADHIHHNLSFRHGPASSFQAVVPVADKSDGRRGRRYSLQVSNPLSCGRAWLRVNKETYEIAEPDVDCAVLDLDRAPNGAVRVSRVRLRLDACERGSVPSPQSMSVASQSCRRR